MHTKTQLESMTMDQLLTLAQKIGAEKSNDKTTLIYNIIDAESIVGPTSAPKEEKDASRTEAEGAAEPAPKKRGRKPKAEKEMTTTQPSRGEEIKEPEASIPTESAEPAPKKRGRKPKSAKEETPEPTLQEEKVATKDATEEPAEPAPKKRGRKPKAEKETGTAFRIIRDIRPVAQILADIQNNIAAPAANAVHSARHTISVTRLLPRAYLNLTRTTAVDFCVAATTTTCHLPMTFSLLHSRLRTWDSRQAM